MVLSYAHEVEVGVTVNGRAVRAVVAPRTTLLDWLHEELGLTGAKKGLSNGAVPVNAHIPADLDVSFVEEFDEAASLIGAKGIGELGATGVDAAVAAAVHDAVGVRVRDLPILPWKVLEG